MGFQPTEEHLKPIQQQGFSPRQSGELKGPITAPPLAVTGTSRNPAHDLQPLLDEFAAEQIVSSPQQAIAATIACHAATRAGDVLRNQQMQAIIHQLSETPEPHRCPYGRPAIVQISTLRVEQEFRRR